MHDEGEDEEELTDSSAAAAGERRRQPHSQDSIEVESEGASTSQGESSRSPHWASDLEEGVEAESEAEAESAGLLDPEGAPAHERSSPEQRQVKRRKISISPVGSSSPLSEHYGNENDAFGSVEQGDPAPAPPEDAETRQAQQPVFRPAPRFKPPTDGQGMLLAAFSPQRRGAKYIPGGLAAELQGWLSEAKGWDCADSAATTANGDDGRNDVSTLRIVVEEVGPGRRMQLVRGRVGPEAASRRFILAGQGRLTGLGQGASIEHGSVVMVGPPVWDAEMDGCVWTVACDWRVV